LRLLGSKQYGLLERSQVLARGFTEAYIDNEIAQGRWLIRHPDVYLIAGSPWSDEQDILAAILALGPSAVASHRTALWLRGVGPRRLTVVEVTVPTHKSMRLKGVKVHRSLDIEKAAVSIIRRIPTTNPLRALVDAGACLTREEVEVLSRQAVGMKLVTWPALAAEVARLAERGRRGVGVMRKILDSLNVTNRFSPSELEVRARRLFRRLGLPEPTCEVVWGREGEWRLDFLWPSLRICIEVDGWSVHASEVARRRDHRKQNRVTLDGNMVLRYDWHDIVRDHRRTSAELLEAFAGR
jgi:hypothetical protein